MSNTPTTGFQNLMAAEKAAGTPTTPGTEIPADKKEDDASPQDSVQKPAGSAETAKS